MENCLTYALRIARYARNTDHLVIRKSHWGWFPHFAVIFELADGSLVKKEYVPTKPRPRWLPPLFFKGVEKTTFYRRERIDDDREDRRAGRMEIQSPACAAVLECRAQMLVELGVAGLVSSGRNVANESQAAGRPIDTP